MAVIAAVVFDLDGTLLDSDDALAAPFVALGVERSQIRFGPLPGEECARLGIAVEEYLSRYDVAAAMPYEGVDALLTALPVPWAVCSNKVGKYGVAELARLAWTPAVSMFADDFGGKPKHLTPVLERLNVAGNETIFVGDTAHDRWCAHDVGARFALAGWNPRAALVDAGDDAVLERPADLLGLL